MSFSSRGNERKRRPSSAVRRSQAQDSARSQHLTVDESPPPARTSRERDQRLNHGIYLGFYVRCLRVGETGVEARFRWRVFWRATGLVRLERSIVRIGLETTELQRMKCKSRPVVGGRARRPTRRSQAPHPRSARQDRSLSLHPPTHAYTTIPDTGRGDRAGATRIGSAESPNQVPNHRPACQLAVAECASARQY